MTMNPLPPQAYTKDTLVKAFQWIQLQGPDIKQLASTPDVLVSLYLKAKLQGEAVLERPSIQNFKNELKNLAGQLGEFAPAQEVVNEQLFDSAYSKVSTGEHSAPPERPAAMSFAPPPPQFTTPAFAQAPPFPTPPTATQAPVTMPPTAPPARSSFATSAPGFTLDEKTAALVRETRELSNLQSDAEAIRLLISIGHRQLKQLYR